MTNACFHLSTRILRRLANTAFMLFVVGALVESTLAQSQEESTVEQRVTIDLCRFHVPETLRNSSASMTIAYSFTVDSSGTPTRMKRMLGAELQEFSEQQVPECLSGWRFEGLASGTRVTVSFRWEHSVGWKYVTVSWKGFSQRINLEERSSDCRKSRVDTAQGLPLEIRKVGR